MIAILSCLAGVFGMLALWCWAWRLWQRAAVQPSSHEQRSLRLVWHGELTPGRRRPTPPPGWLFEAARDAGASDEAPSDDVPVARRHPSSNSDTSQFPREARLHCVEERTEVLSEDQILDPGETQPSIGGNTCKIGLFAGPLSDSPQLDESGCSQLEQR